MFRILVLLPILFLTILPQFAFACSCSVGGHWVSEFLEDKIVFEGQVLQTKWLNNEDDRPFGDNAETTFKTVKFMKGVAASKISIQHHSQGSACGMFFIMGSEDLVVARINSSGIATTSSCTSMAVPEITLLDYFENDVDIYIPSRWDCTEEEINTENDSKNCSFWSDKAADLRQDAMVDRWRKKRKKAKANVKKTKN